MHHQSSFNNHFPMHHQSSFNNYFPLNWFSIYVGAPFRYNLETVGLGGYFLLFEFFFFFGKKGISIKKLNSQRLNRTAPAWIQPSKIRIENSKQIHRRIFKQNKISILLGSLPSKMVSDSLCFSITMFESNLWDLRCQLPAVIQQRGEKRVWLGGVAQGCL